MKLIKLFFIPVLIATFVCITVYTISQQTLRLGANEIPKQLAVDTFLKIENNNKIEDIVTIK